MQRHAKYAECGGGGGGGGVVMDRDDWNWEPLGGRGGDGGLSWIAMTGIGNRWANSC